PSKFLIQAAHVASPHNNDPPFRGIHSVTDRVTNFTALTAQNRALVEGLRQEKYANVIANLDNVEYIEGLGRLTRKAEQLVVEVRSSHEDQTPSKILPADRVILASGVRTSLPSQLAADLAKIEYLTNETAYFEPKRPESLIVLGGGYIALEAAQMYARLGSKVTILQRSEYVLSSLEHDVSSDLAEHFKVEGIDVEVGVDITSVVSSEDGVIVKGNFGTNERTFKASRLFIATGRRANTEHISDLPIKLVSTLHGRFVVSNTLQTTFTLLPPKGNSLRSMLWEHSVAENQGIWTTQPFRGSSLHLPLSQALALIFQKLVPRESMPKHRLSLFIFFPELLYNSTHEVS
ncbi:hypothetical protein LTR28_009146, partial [Elasticomyces elasticus]